MTTRDTELVASYWLHAGDTEPMTGREWSSWTFEDRVEKLADVGFDGIGIVHNDLDHILNHRGRTLADLRAILDEHGIDYVELEILNNWLLPEDDYRRQAERQTREMLLEAADVLGADRLKVGNFFAYPVAPDLITERFETLCTEFDIPVGYELMPNEPNADTLDDAVAFVDGPDNGGLFVDSWHMAKLGISNERVSQLDASNVVAAELADGYDETEMSFVEESSNLRKLPGEGEFDLDGFVDAIEQTGFDGMWGHEILSEEYRRLSMNDAYTRAYETAMAVLQ